MVGKRDWLNNLMAGRVKTVGDLLEELNYLDANTPVVSENGDPIFVGLEMDAKRGNKFKIYGNFKKSNIPYMTDSTEAAKAKADQAEALQDLKDAWNK